MRGRVLAVVLLSAALAAGLLVGARLPPPSSAHPAAAGPTSPGGTTTPTTPTTSPSPTATGQPGPDIYPITRLAPGEKPPQFVVLSFDGACSHQLFQHYFDLGQQTNSRFTFFMSGLCLVPDAQHDLYHPPGKPVGYSAIGFADPKLVNGRIEDWSKAYDNGYGVGTHFLGHFCDAQGVGTWSAADWRSELDQQQHFFDDWAQVNKDNPYADLSLKPSFPFSAVQGDRTPCLLGRRDQMYKAFQERHFTYDASSTGSLVWPKKIAKYDLWNFPMPLLNIVGWPGHKHAIAMDYNFLFQMNGPKTTAPPAKCAQIRDASYQTYLAALGAVERGNRAPLVLGNHFNTWACGAFRDALTEFVRTAHQQYPDVRFVSFEYLARWLNAQSPKVLAELQARPAASY